MATIYLDFDKIFDHYLIESGLTHLHHKSEEYELVRQTYCAGFIGGALIAEELIKLEYGDDPNRSLAVEICMRLQKLAIESHDGKNNS